MSTPNTHYTAAELSRMLDGVRSVYFLGIGGISMSSLAVLTRQLGYRVGGYDRTETSLTKALAQKGIVVDTLADAHHTDTYDAVVYTVAIPEDQPELNEAKRRGLPLISRSNYMGYLMTAYRSRIGVAGTHGKSTTTGMLAEIFFAADAEPTVLCGAVLPRLGSAFSVGGREHMLFEACEYMDSFLDFYPTMAVVLNTELDHVDYFCDIAQMRASYAAFADKVGAQGYVVCNADDEHTMIALQHCVGRRVTFGIEADADYVASDIRLEKETREQSFALCCRGEYLGRISLRVQGRHNVYNALAAACAAREQGICMRAITAGLWNFTGVHRRMEYKGQLAGAALYDDYAHHPTEIRSSVEAARAMGCGRLICVFQSHTYSRTAALFDEFVAALRDADAVIIAPIYAAREQNTYGISEASLAAALQDKGIPASCGESLDDTAAQLLATVRPGDTVLVMGAGDIERIYPLLFR
ncbi:MAG: UDP-N-acetylmuramate--L-alanine ligase [Clostridia bacterium]|nr:UDP-N-acetylmuramate--L-alanine ligase [Clostridia bacterium]